jgi:hypothetical protein
MTAHTKHPPFSNIPPLAGPVLSLLDRVFNTPIANPNAASHSCKLFSISRDLIPDMLAIISEMTESTRRSIGESAVSDEGVSDREVEEAEVERRLWSCNCTEGERKSPWMNDTFLTGETGRRSSAITCPRGPTSLLATWDQPPFMDTLA